MTEVQSPQLSQETHETISPSFQYGDVIAKEVSSQFWIITGAKDQEGKYKNVPIIFPSLEQLREEGYQINTRFSAPQDTKQQEQTRESMSLGQRLQQSDVEIGLDGSGDEEDGLTQIGHLSLPTAEYALRRGLATMIKRRDIFPGTEQTYVDQILGEWKREETKQQTE